MHWIFYLLYVCLEHDILDGWVLPIELFGVVLNSKTRKTVKIGLIYCRRVGRRYSTWWRSAHVTRECSITEINSFRTCRGSVHRSLNDSELPRLYALLCLGSLTWRRLIRMPLNLKHFRLFMFCTVSGWFDPCPLLPLPFSAPLHMNMHSFFIQRDSRVSYSKSSWEDCWRRALVYSHVLIPLSLIHKQ